MFMPPLLPSCISAKPSKDRPFSVRVDPWNKMASGLDAVICTKARAGSLPLILSSAGVGVGPGLVTAGVGVKIFQGVEVAEGGSVGVGVNVVSRGSSGRGVSVGCTG